MIPTATASAVLFESLPAEVLRWIGSIEDPAGAPGLGGVLHEGDGASLAGLLRGAAIRNGPILTIRSIRTASDPEEDYDPADPFGERSVSIDTAAVRENASLLALELRWTRVRDALKGPS